MGDRSKIEWTATHNPDGTVTPGATWNPIVGCTHVSPGCDHCYAATVHNRRYLAWKRGAWPGAPEQYHQPFKQVQLLPDRLDVPLRWRRPRRIFVNSLSDLFHEDVPDEFICAVFGVMAAAPHHTFQILTKRPQRMLEWMRVETNRCWGADRPTVQFCAWEAYARTKNPKARAAMDVPIPWPLPNVWLGVSVEDHRRADERIPLLLETPAAVRFLSCEPLLGQVDLHRWVPTRDPTDTDHLPGVGHCLRCGCDWVFGEEHECPPGFGPTVDWVICGGESGPGARPMHPDWARSLRDQCEAAGVAYFLKQWGEWRVSTDENTRPHTPVKLFAGGLYARVGKKAAGRELDGRTWDEYPVAASA